LSERHWSCAGEASTAVASLAVPSGSNSPVDIALSAVFDAVKSTIESVRQEKGSRSLRREISAAGNAWEEFDFAATALFTSPTSLAVPLGLHGLLSALIASDSATYLTSSGIKISAPPWARTAYVSAVLGALAGDVVFVF
jgi:hypothetical protein